MMFDYTDVTFKQVTHSADLWIDFFNNDWLDNLESFLISNTHIKRLFFYDWFDGYSISLSRVNKLKKLAFYFWNDYELFKIFHAITNCFCFISFLT